MAQMHRLSRQDARRIAVRAQFLTGQRPADLLTLVRQLTTLQLDPVSAIAPSADLVAWSKLGSSYQPKHLQDALADRRLIELRAFLRPAEDIALYRSAMAAWTGNGRLLDFMVARGEVAVAGRKGRDRLWDLAERVYPDHPVIPIDEAGWELDRRGLRALGIARLTGPTQLGVGGRVGEPAVVEGVRGEWRVDPAYLDGTSGLSEPFAARAALL